MSEQAFPDYKNWMPKGMVASFAGGSVASAAAAVAAGARMAPGMAKAVVTRGLGVCALGLAGASLWSLYLYRAFDYRGRRQLSRQVIEGIAERVSVVEDGCCLDVGCGSGALAIAVAKRNPTVSVVGIDRWGAEYASFSQGLCERNAAAEGVANVRFAPGDAQRLAFADETFDAVVSNYVYHNISCRDRCELVRETLRTLKRGGTFAIHDIFSPAKYGDVPAFVQALRDEGYAAVELVDTANGMWMAPSEARLMGLAHSALLTGVK